jgi:electron transport complex protein RnfG
MRFRICSHRVARLAAAGVISGVLVALPASGATYWTVPGVLKSFFAQSKRVSYRKLSLNASDAANIAEKSGAAVKREWVVYTAESDGKPDGYAIKDEEKGMHEPIDFAVKFTTSGAVERIEIMEYREAYGDEVRGDRFRAQFKGKTASDPITAGRDIDIVSGASISSRSVALGVKRDALILELALKSGNL